MLQRGKEILSKFDIILVTEWLQDESTRNYVGYLFGAASRHPAEVINSDFNKIFDGSKHVVVGSSAARKRLSPELMFNKDATLALLKRINRWDIQLFEYAKELVAARALATNKLNSDDIDALSEDKSIFQKMNGIFSSSKSQFKHAVCPIGYGMSKLVLPPYAAPQYGFNPKSRMTEHHPGIKLDKSLPSQFRVEIGLFQPVDHKGPLLENLY